MELREWLIILGLALVTLIVVDGVRRLQRQRRVPRLDAVDDNRHDDPDLEAREADINWELPNGGARVVKPAEYGPREPRPKLERQEHPGPSRVLAGFRQQAESARQERPEHEPRRGAQDRQRPESVQTDPLQTDPVQTESAQAGSRQAQAQESAASSPSPAAEPAARREPSLSALDDDDQYAAPDSRRGDPLAADDHDDDQYDERYQQDDERYRLVDLEGVGDSFKSGSKRVGASVQRFGASLQKNLAERREQKRQEKARREREKAERQRLAREQPDAETSAAPHHGNAEPMSREAHGGGDDHRDVFESPEPPVDGDKVRMHPVLEKALRHDVSAAHARETLGAADELIVISVMAREEEGFSGTALLDLMLACGLRYDRDMGVFHRFETEDPESRLQFTMVNVVKPGTFPLSGMDEFSTPGITLLMPLPGAEDASAAFEAMVETAMVVVRHLGGELKDENHSVMTAQTVEFARQRVQEFVRRHRLHRYQVN